MSLLQLVCFARDYATRRRDICLCAWVSCIRGAEHKPGTRSNNESAIRFHAETTDHDIHPDYVEILERNVNNRKQRLFLEALHSIQDINCVNEHVQFPQVYLTLGTSLETGGV